MIDSEKAQQVVYISCVEEVRYSFVSHLSEALRRKRINDVFVDSDDLLSAKAKAKVERSRVSVMVLPGNRTVCIDKLVKVLDCQRNEDQVVVPVLYGVSSLQGEWLGALELRGLTPVHQSRKECSDSELVKEIVRDVYEKIFYMERIGIYSKLLEIENMVCRQPLGIRCVGIWGMPGIGKTTLAKAVFDQISGEFDAYCFIEDYEKAIHEKGLYCLLEEQLLKEEPVVDGTSRNLRFLRDELNNKRVLVVLDDVRNPLVAESFLRRFDWFCPESLIIITSRDKQVFRLCRVNHIYEVQGLNEKEALHLFLLCASIESRGEQNIDELSMKVVEYANGNPLALRIYGKELKGKKNRSEMRNAFLKLKRSPPSKIVNVVKSTYETLSNSEKNIFLDIACFFRGENVDYVMQLLEGCDFFPHVGVNVLVDKCMLTISENLLQMHNLIQDVGREIINGETVFIVRRRRLWEPWSIKYLLEDNENKRSLGTEYIEGMFLDTLKLGFDVKPAAFENMLNLRLLKIYSSNTEIHPVFNFPKGFLHSLPNQLRLLHWENYPLQFLPQYFDPWHLVEINMPYSRLEKLWGRTKNLEKLKTIRLCHSQQLVDIDDVLQALNLEVIDLQGCTRLQSFPATGQLLHLRVVNLSGCTEINHLPEVSLNIETLHLQGTGIIELPLSFVNPNYRGLLNLLTEIPGLSGVLNLEKIDLERLTSLMKMNSPSQDRGKLIFLDLKDCSRLRSLPDMVNLEFLKVLDLSGCSELKTIEGFPRNLKELYIAGTAVIEMAQLPQSLELLYAHGCVALKSICLDFEQLPMHYTFSNCFSLSPQVVNDFLVKALANVKHILREHPQELNKALAFSFCVPYANKNSTLNLQPGSSVMTRLTPSRSTLVGFYMLVEVAFSEDNYDATGFGISCVCRWKDMEGRSHRLTFHYWAPGEAIPKFQKDHIFVFCDVKICPSTSEGKDPDILADLVVFEFFPVNKQRKRLDDSCAVKRCGVYVISAETGNTNPKISSPDSSFVSMDFSGYDVEEVLRVGYDVAPLIASIELDISYGLRVLANTSLIHVSSNGEIVIHCLLQKMSKEILHRLSMLLDTSKELTRDVSMASSSSHNSKYDVFLSFSGQDVRKNFLSHLLQIFKSIGITTFIENEVGRGQLIQTCTAIKESRISIVLLSENYASSSWNLNELVEIANSKEDLNQIVIPIFYDVDPSDVKEQTGDFGRRFEKVCEDKTENVKQQWCQALTTVANILGYCSANWDNEANMMETIATDVLKKLKITAAKDFRDFVDLEDHISKMSSLLCLESEEVRMVGIWGPSGIGKSTIARALYNQLAHQFRRSIFLDRAFVDKTMEYCRRAKLDGYDTTLHLQTQFLSEVIGQKQIKVHHLGMVRERLKDQKVLIIVDDADDQVLLDALAGKNQWFGSGSRIIVTTKDKQLPKSHGIDHVYEVDFPSKKQALQMFCQSAFRQNSPPDGFMELAYEVTKLAGNLPLCLSILGLSLQGKSKMEWMEMLPQLGDILDEGIKKALAVRHQSLSEHGKYLPSLSPFPMASYSPGNWRYHVFLSFCGQDVRKSFLSHFLVALKRKSIITFKNNEMNLGQPIRESETAEAIRESRISIIVISRKYASLGWLLNELVEITKCMYELNQTLIPIFYDVDQSDVRNQTGEFGMHFDRTCYSRTEDEKQRWRQSLINIANITGLCSLHWDNEADMIEKIVEFVSQTLSFKPSIASHDLVGIEDHIAKVNSMLCLESNEVKMVGIWGPPGIGKTAIARALYIELSSKFELSAFLILSNDYKRANSDDDDANLHFQNLLLSEIFGQKYLKRDHLGMIEAMLKKRQVLIILDGVDDSLQLRSLAGKSRWFGSGSRIIVTTKDIRLLRSHCIADIYEVDLPSKKQALDMFCQFTFGQKYPPEGFTELVVEVVKLADSDLSVMLGLRSLAEKSVIHITEHGNITMHHLQQNLGREIVRNESIDEPGKRRFLVDSQNICQVLVDKTGTESVLGILLDMSEVDELFISERGFSGMRNLRFLKFDLRDKEFKREVNVHLPHGIDYLSCKLRLLHWEAFPMRFMPSNFCPKNLVELTMEASKLEKLWDGAQPLGSLKCMSLRGSFYLREIPDLSYATNLERLDLGGCSSLMILPPSIGHLHKLKDLNMKHCIYLEVLPTGINLESLYCLNLNGCLQLRSFPEISRNISYLYLDRTAIEEVPQWIEDISGLSYLSMSGCNKLMKISPNICKLKLLVEVDFSDCRALTEDSWQNHPEEISTSLMRVDMSGNSFERLPDTWTSIQPKDLILGNCKNLVSLPNLPASLSLLMANLCDSLESLYGSFDQPQMALQFINSFKLNHQAREFILHSDCAYAILPGEELPAYFTHRVNGNILTASLPRISLSRHLLRYKACIVIESRSGWFDFGVNWNFRGGNDKKYFTCWTNTFCKMNHLIMFGFEFLLDGVNDPPVELNYGDVQFEFLCLDHMKETMKIKECGIQLMEVSPYLDDSRKRSGTEDGNKPGENAEVLRRSRTQMRVRMTKH
ncbi:AAA+ ATPase domain [Arabidopsis thaliana x Arabidopsis arenosa]|uniref:ADP-ribosyl cyclase/cyclic ADP-ribose hydrolase n=1 Tax=Arabidopsis thaliana x Arabidopsis arenosa TaxID=1240361 RepID=A0A8T1XJ70_9BRAS|nr:AAA+ ATPase domain [Arabidopsis thaliana x Arabidopsis arenosa]